MASLSLDEALSRGDASTVVSVSALAVDQDPTLLV